MSSKDGFVNRGERKIQNVGKMNVDECRKSFPDGYSMHFQEVDSDAWEIR